MTTPTDFTDALDNFVGSALELLDIWQRAEREGRLPDPVGQYPRYLPSFDEFLDDLMRWRESLVTAVCHICFQTRHIRSIRVHTGVGKVCIGCWDDRLDATH